MRLIVAIELLAATIVALLLWSAAGRAHDSWISSNQLRDPVSGQWCCNEHDCEAEPADGVRETREGYLIVSTGEVIPFARAIPQSADGRFWRCRYLWGEDANKTRCLIIPPSGS